MKFDWLRTIQRQERHWVTDMCTIKEATIIIIIIIIIIITIIIIIIFIIIIVHVMWYKNACTIAKDACYE